MKAQRSGMARRALAALTALPLAFAMSACQFGLGGEGDSGGSNPAPAASESDGGSPPQASGDPKVRNSEVLGSWEGRIDSRDLRLDVNAVVVKDGVTTLTLTVTNTGSTSTYGWMNAFGDFSMLSSGVKLIDVQNRLVYSPGKGENGACMCSGYDNSALEAGASRSVYTTFKELPEGVTAIDVKIEGITEPFENIPVTRE